MNVHRHRHLRQFAGLLAACALVIAAAACAEKGSARGTSIGTPTAPGSAGAGPATPRRSSITVATVAPDLAPTRSEPANSAPAPDPIPTTDTTAAADSVTTASVTDDAPDEAPTSPDPPSVEHWSGPEGFRFEISDIHDSLRQRIDPTSWRPGCPVSLSELRYLRLSHRNFDGVDTTGELIVHRDHVEAMFQVFSALWRAQFPIRSMRLIDDFGGDDFASIEADNTSAFNCRFVEGTTRWSNHATGGAIDVNPLENPYVVGGTTSHPASVPFLVRQGGTGVILEGGPVVAAFDAAGWAWGGRWGEPLDYQHFSAAGG